MYEIPDIFYGIIYTGCVIKNYEFLWQRIPIYHNSWGMYEMYKMCVIVINVKNYYERGNVFKDSRFNKD